METDPPHETVVLKSTRKILEQSCGKGRTFLWDCGTEEYKKCWILRVKIESFCGDIGTKEYKGLWY